MNRINFLSLVLLTVLVLACAPKMHSPIEEIVVIEETPIIDEVNKEDDSEKFKPSKDMISMSVLAGNYTVEVGQELYYAANVHGSVGSSTSASSTNEGVLDLKSEILEYNKKQVEGMTGGDAAVLYFIFEAMEVGTSEVKVQDWYRGELQNEYTITITVVESTKTK